MSAATAERNGRSAFAVIPLSRLRLGARLGAPLYDDADDVERLLLNKGQTLSAAAVGMLKARGVTTVRIDARFAARLQSADRPAALPAAAAAARPAVAFGGRVLPADAAAHRVRRSRGVASSADEVMIYEDGLRAAEDRVASLLDAAGAGLEFPGHEACGIIDDALRQIEADFDLFVRLGLKLEPNGPDAARAKPTPHGLRASRLAIAVGVAAGLDRERIARLGLGCLLSDLGMSHLDDRIVSAPRRLTRVEFLEITKHPAKTFDRLEGCPEIPAEARIVAYQMHERWDGSGYPRGRVGQQIHPLARIAMLADVFVALVSPRPWRPAFSGSQAIRQLLIEVREGRFDPAAARSLLEALSLFPVGTFVSLSDGRTARVVSANPGAYARPVVSAWPPDREDLAEVIDLVVRDDLEVVASGR